MTLAKDGYIPRIIDERLEQYLRVFGAVQLRGPKWCGKTWTALHKAQSATMLMDPIEGAAAKLRAELNPTLILEGAKPRLIDEWQEVEGVWDAVRYAVDQSSGKGQYILTGSIKPRRKKYRHSGAGRIATLQMSPMTLSESGDSSNQISLASLFDGDFPQPLVADIGLKELIDLTVRGGWPDALDVAPADYQIAPQGYIDAIVNNELFDEESPQRDAAKLKRLLYALARTNTGLVNDSALTSDYLGAALHDSSLNEDHVITVARSSVDEYLSELRKVFIIEDVAPWDPKIRSRVRIRQAPKRMFVDPSLAIASLGIGAGKLYEDLMTYGLMFENLVLRDLRVYARASNGEVFHYRDNSDLEIDAIVELQDGLWGAFEIKLGEHQVDGAAKQLLRLKDKIIGAGGKPPACLGVITGGGTGWMRDDGVAVIPINAFCA